MWTAFYHTRRVLLSYTLEGALYAASKLKKPRSAKAEKALADKRMHPEDYRPLSNVCFQNPYDFYALLRKDYPIYQLANGIYCISRYEDIAEVSRNTQVFSSNYQGIIAGLKAGQSVEKLGQAFAKIGDMGVVPSDVLALSDPPKHTEERKTGHKGLNSHFVKSLEGQIEDLCRTMMAEFLPKGEVDFMAEFGWRLPMRLIIQLLGFPEKDFEKVKFWCMHTIASQSGICTGAEIMRSRKEAIAFMRYCWSQFLIAKKNPRNDLSRIFVEAAADPGNSMTEQIAVSAIFQLLIAGSDSSATSMGNALKLLIENPETAAEIRADIDGKLPAFIEEVFRLETAFQGHFRWTKEATTLHGVSLPKGSRIFLMWASGNRDDAVFPEPNRLDLNRKNGKKHLCFGYGIHACIGRELARSEIRIVLREFLLNTKNLRLNGEAPFLASMFARTLLQLPIAFDLVSEVNPIKTQVMTE